MARNKSHVPLASVSIVSAVKDSLSAIADHRSIVGHWSSRWDHSSSEFLEVDFDENLQVESGNYISPTN